MTKTTTTKKKPATPERSILEYLRENADATSGAICNHFGVTLTGLCQRLDVLEHRGLVVRRRSEKRSHNGRRMIAVNLTREGFRELHRAAG